MIIDKAKLKALAERLIAATDRLHEDEKCDELGDAWSLADDAYVEASEPKVLLGLLAENERLSLHSHCHLLRAQTVEVERDKWESLYRSEHATCTRLLDTLTGLRNEIDQLKAVHGESGDLSTGAHGVNADLSTSGEAAP